MYIQTIIIRPLAANSNEEQCEERNVLEIISWVPHEMAGERGNTGVLVAVGELIPAFVLTNIPYVRHY